mmetsp:Transcript_37416/g.94419  ORF Transcript_37416/g.94419 Transcript_37416/m.94419 type:complete len:271 (-) Transcript_37416:426-1238(-)
MVHVGVHLPESQLAHANLGVVPPKVVLKHRHLQLLRLQVVDNHVELLAPFVTRVLDPADRGGLHGAALADLKPDVRLIARDVFTAQQLDVQCSLGGRRDAEVGHDGEGHAVGVDEHAAQHVLDGEAQAVLDAGQRHEVDALDDLQAHVHVRRLEQRERGAAHARHLLHQRLDGDARLNLEVQVGHLHGHVQADGAEAQEHAHVKLTVRAPHQWRLNDHLIITRVVALDATHARRNLANVKVLVLDPGCPCLLRLLEALGAQHNVLNERKL